MDKLTALWRSLSVPQRALAADVLRIVLQTIQTDGAALDVAYQEACIMAERDGDALSPQIQVDLQLGVVRFPCDDSGVPQRNEVARRKLS